jgi:hypothetical protein
LNKKEGLPMPQTITRLHLIYTLTFLVGLALVSPDASAQDGPQMASVASLPTHVKTPPKQVGLYVDWSHAIDAQATVFVVNRSDKPVLLQHAYGNCYLKLEALAKNGNWERTQSYFFEQCGTGLGQFTLKPGHWFKQLHGFATPPTPARPAKQGQGNAVEIENLKQQIAEIKQFMTRARLTKEGYNSRIQEIKTLESKVSNLETEAQVKKTGDDSTSPLNAIVERQVRIRIYDNNCRSYSNIGKASVSLPMIEQCKQDPMAILFADIHFLRGVIFDRIDFRLLPNGPVTPNPKHLAIQSLAQSWHGSEEVEATLSEIIGGDDETLATIAKLLRDRIEKQK